VCRLLEDCQEEFNLVNKSPLALGERGAWLTCCVAGCVCGWLLCGC
jgi:hypothetical protein